MDKEKFLADRFEAHRSHLRRVAYRMLGSQSEADDAVQEAWLRLSRSEPDGIQNLGGWLTTVVARVCLDMLRSRKSRREEPLDDGESAPSRSSSVPSRRRCWPIRSVSRCWSSSRRWRPPNAWPSCCTTCSTCRSRRSRPSSGDRRRRHASSRAAPVGACAERPGPPTPMSPASGRSSMPSWRPRAPATSRGFWRCSIPTSCSTPIVPPCRWATCRHCAAAVAANFRGRALAARPALVDGALGVVVAPLGKLRLVLRLTIAEGRIAAIDVVADPEHLRGVKLSVLD